jgi:hypothetical protein
MSKHCRCVNLFKEEKSQIPYGWLSLLFFWIIVLVFAIYGFVVTNYLIGGTLSAVVVIIALIVIFWGDILEYFCYF